MRFAQATATATVAEIHHGRRRRRRPGVGFALRKDEHKLQRPPDVPGLVTVAEAHVAVLLLASASCFRRRRNKNARSLLPRHALLDSCAGVPNQSGHRSKTSRMDCGPTRKSWCVERAAPRAAAALRARRGVACQISMRVGGSVAACISAACIAVASGERRAGCHAAATHYSHLASHAAAPGRCLTARRAIHSSRRQCPSTRRPPSSSHQRPSSGPFARSDTLQSCLC